MANINENRKLMVENMKKVKSQLNELGMAKGSDNRLMKDLMNILDKDIEHKTTKNGRVSTITSFSVPAGQNVLEVEEFAEGYWTVTIRAKQGIKIWANEWEFGYDDIEDEATAMKAAMKMAKKHKAIL
jgi:hypothetical protein